MLDVITIGTAVRDVFLQSKLFKTVRDPKHLEKLGFVTGEAQCFALGGKLEVEPPTMTIGGGAANTAVTFARQGFRVAAAVKIGRDQSGRAVLADLRQEGVKPLAIFDERVPTAYSTILISPSGERTILHYRGASEDLTTSDLPLMMLRARWAYLVPGHIPYGVFMTFFQALVRRRVKIAIDLSAYYLKLGLTRLRPILRHVAVIHMNREEGAYLTGFRYEDEKKIFKKFDELVPGLAIMTDGPKGVLVSDGARIYRAGIYKEKRLVDRTGSGDAFGSGFVAGLMHASGKRKGEGKTQYTPDDIQYAIRLASANATSVVEYIGAQTGILRSGAFERGRRWRSLKITQQNLS